MRLRTTLAAGSLFILGGLCTCVLLMGGFLAYRFLPDRLGWRPAPTPVVVVPSPTPGGQTVEPVPTATRVPVQPTPSPFTPPPLSPQPTPTPSVSTPTPAEVKALRLRLEVPVERIVAIGTSPDDRTLSLFGQEGRTEFLDIQTGEVTGGPRAPETVEEQALSPDGDFMALRMASGIYVGSISEEDVLFVLTPEEPVRRIAFSPMGTLFLVGGETTLSGYYVETGELAFQFELFGPADDFAMTPDEQLIFQMTSEFPDLEVWDTFSGEWWGSIEFDPLTAIALSPDGQLLAVAENQMKLLEEGYEAPFPTRVTLWQVSVFPEEQTVELNYVVDLEFTPETERNFPLPLKALMFTPDGRSIVGVADWIGEGDLHGRLYVWEAESGQMVGRVVLPSRPWEVELLEAGEAVAVLLGLGPVSDRVQVYELSVP